jgi:glycerate-2-kinase
MAGVLEHLGRDAAFAARSSDGRDFLRGVAGAWVDATTKRRAQALGMDWLHLKRENDSYRGLLAVDQLLAGGHTGWNLCDLYVAVL